jgi:hypothetical protein
MLSRAIVSLLVCLAATIARADGPADIIELHDGSFLQGRLTEWKPGSRAVIVLLNGESRTVHWSEIARTSGPSFEKIRDRGGQEVSQDVDLEIDSTVVIPPPPIDPPSSPTEQQPTEQQCEPNLELPPVEPRPNLTLPLPVIPPPSLIAPRPATFLMDARKRRGFLLAIMSVGPLIAGAVYTGIGSTENERGMAPLHDTYIGLGSVLLVGATASLVSGIVLLSTHKRDDPPTTAHASLKLSPGGLALAGNF